MTRSRLSGSLFAIFIALVIPATAGAQATFPTPLLTSIHPMGGQPGTEVELMLKGTDLEHADGAVWWPDPGAEIKVKPKLDAKGAVVANTLLLSLPESVKPGAYELRVATPQGLSNPRVFQIADLPSIQAAGKGSSAANAEPIHLDCAVHGIFKGPDPHWFQFEAAKGQRVTAVFAGEKFDVRTRLHGALLDGRGREIARLREGLLDARLPSAGPFFLKIHDLMFGQGDDYGYRLSLTTGAVVHSHHIPAGENSGGDPGESAVVYGWNLPGGAVERPLLARPGEPLEKLVTDRQTAEKLASASPLPPVALGGDPAIESAGPRPISIGESLHGWFPANGAAAAFDLDFKTGDRFVIEVFSSWLGHPTDPLLVVERLARDAEGGETLSPQAEVNDPPALVPPRPRLALLDPSYAFEAKEEGAFRIRVSDPLNAANGRRHPFSIRIRQGAASPLSGALAVHPTLPPAAAVGPFEIGSANLWRGGRSMVELILPHPHETGGGLELVCADLPPGVTCLGGFIGARQRSGFLVLEAANDAPAAGVPLAVAQRTAHLIWAVRDINREHPFSRIGGAPALGVVAQPAPALAQAGDGAVIEIEAAGKVVVPVTLQRHADCTDAITLKLLGLGDPAKAAVVTIPAKAGEGSLTIDAKALGLTAGEWGCVLQGPAKMPVRRNAAQVAKAAAAAEKAKAAHTAAAKALQQARAAEDQAGKEDAEGAEAAAKALRAAEEKVAAAEKARDAAAKTAADLDAKNPPKDATFIVVSNPLRLRVK